MLEVHSWQVPAQDDISPEALEYLFTPKYRAEEEPPWVKVSVDSEVSIEEDAERLKAKLEVVRARLEQVSTQLQTVTFQLGYLQGKLIEKEEQLRVLPDYRAKAARAVVADSALKAYKEQVESLQAELDTIKESWIGKLYRLSIAFAEIYKPEKPYLPVMPMIMLVTFWLVVAVTMIGLREHWWVY